ncbi:ergot alkaloid biosynthesis protein [Enhygromyxa salina]|uniref:NAD(P)H azoreductase n=1 Tax=Enhygromyxa salina TaxID=215803 RepID=A0A2S9YYN9_9BACT|nr:ergot alkaloid biosynthesis protein [Enhygromyxa salina]PRQ10194.1 NAD(P)H azoreductase [Enhygromyxa salina]
MTGRVLLTGGSGKTARRIAAQLRSRGIEPRTTSRSPAGPEVVRFDWSDHATHAAALDGVAAIYVLAPTDAIEQLPIMAPLLERALEQGVQRFVLLSASSVEEGGPMMGEVHTWLRRHAPEWVVLRPTWFMQNFSEAQHLATIRDEGLLYTAANEGRIGFIDAEDIAAVAVRALTDVEVTNEDLILTGPRTLSYDEVAAILSRVAGRPVRHHTLTQAQLSDRMVAMGMLPAYADALAAMDTAIAAGAEDRVSEAVLRVLGRAPGRFEDFAAREASVWRS